MDARKLVTSTPGLFETDARADAGAVPPPATGRVAPGAPGADKFFPDSPRASLAQYRAAAAGCRGCPLYKDATQTVFGEGPAHATMMLVGEQPGDQEDLQGHPFVGPAGGVLRKALDEAGIDAASVYLTNAVKHFKWTPSPRGKRRIHAKPGPVEIRACKPWLEREIALVKPKLVVLLGATAAQALLGSGFKVTRQRGELVTQTPFDAAAIATVHPSSILRAPDEAARERSYRAFVADLKAAAAAAERLGAGRSREQGDAGGRRSGSYR